MKLRRMFCLVLALCFCAAGVVMGAEYADTDNDTIPDVCDQCPVTSPGSVVHPNGCEKVKGDFDIATDSGTLRIKAVINTVDGPIDAVFYNGGEAITDRGDRVIRGHFYADPADVSWGDPGNPELYVKIWFDVNGRTDVNFFHVSVPDIEVYSAYPYEGAYDQHATATMDNRYVRHEFQKNEEIVPDPEDTDDDGDGYTENQGDCDDSDSWTYPGAEEIMGDGIDQDCDGEDSICQPDFSGKYSGRYSGDDAGTFSVTIRSDGTISGTAQSDYGSKYSLSGEVDPEGGIYMTTGNVGGTSAIFQGSIDSSGNVRGTWENSAMGMDGSFSGSREG